MADSETWICWFDGFKRYSQTLIAYATYILGALFFEGNKRSKILDMNVVGSSTTIFLKSLLWQFATIGLFFHSRISDGSEFEVIEGSSGKMWCKASLIRLVRLPR